MSDEMKKQIKEAHNNFAVGLVRLADWNKLAPGMKLSEQAFALMEESIESSPNVVRASTNEIVLDYLSKTNEETGVFLEIPAVPAQISAVSASGTAVLDVYNGYVKETASAFQGDPDVAEWAKITFVKSDEFREKQNRSGIVHQRLIQLNPTLGDLHQICINASLAAQAGTQNPIEAAENQNRLLDQFRGHLIGKCRSGKGTKYSRISDNLAANSSLTKTIVTDGQQTHDKLNDEYVDVRKSKSVSTGNRMVELLMNLEDHIYDITNALDPAKVGIAFYT